MAKRSGQVCENNRRWQQSDSLHSTTSRNTEATHRQCVYAMQKHTNGR